MKRLKLTAEANPRLLDAAGKVTEARRLCPQTPPACYTSWPTLLLHLASKTVRTE